jgi:peptidoglycan L-alanyl-D-glutamate endopeptidase CwlK
MAKFGKKSLEKLKDADSKLQLILKGAIQIYDFTILQTHRGEKEQNKYYKQGKSKLKYPESKHNQYPSKAVDIAPYPIDWNDRKRFYYLAGLIKGVADNNGIKIRWGGDWDSDGKFDDQTFDDLPHFEVVG